MARFSALCLLASLSNVTSTHADDAKALFSNARSSIYQIRVIEKTSDEKAAIGSGFQVSEDGLIATNFHVVSDAVHQPDKYRLVYASETGDEGNLSIADFDVVHDLALVHRLDGPSDHLVLGDDLLENGQPLYSIGNPLDLGQSIVTGSYNGLIETSFYEKLLFTGSLNPGMSGGPTLDDKGRVVGVNVSSAGNQISFLVPVKHLRELLDSTDRPAGPEGFRARIEVQLLADQERKFDLFFKHEWKVQQLGQSLVVSAPKPYFNCWGDTPEQNNRRYVTTMRSCISEDVIFISRRLTTGAFDYQFMVMSSDELNSLQFNRVYGSMFSSMHVRNRANKDQVTNYKCHQAFVADTPPETTDGFWRTLLCARQYRKYTSLYDILFLSTYVGGDREGFITHFALSGVTQENANRFAAKFMRTNAWR